MKKYLALIALLLCTASVCRAQEVAFTVDRTRHEFGELAIGKSYVTTFTVTSTGTAPLVLIDATTGCKCTKAAFPRKPLRKGEKAVVTVTFDADLAGAFNKLIQVRTNAPKKMEFRVGGAVKR